MDLFAKLAHKIGNNLVNSKIIKAEDIEIYIYGINQILVSILNIASALIIGLFFGVFLEVAVFMVSYIPLRTFAGGYHSKTPLRCYVFSVIMLIVVSLGLKYLHIADWVYYAVDVLAIIMICIFSPVEDKNKPLNAIEHKVYKRRTILITAIEFTVVLLLKLMMLDGLSISIAYSFAVLSFMLIAGKAKNRFFHTKQTIPPKGKLQELEDGTWRVIP